MCALVTGVQTCALPIWAFDPALEYHRALVRRRAGADPQHAASRRSGRSDRGSVDRKSVVKGKSVSVRVDFGGRRIIKKKKRTHIRITSTHILINITHQTN